MCADDHSGSGYRAARSYNSHAFNIDDAKAACAIDTQFRMITERGQFDVGFANEFQQVALIADFNGFTVQCYVVLGLHIR